MVVTIYDWHNRLYSDRQIWRDIYMVSGTIYVTKRKHTIPSLEQDPFMRRDLHTQPAFKIVTIMVTKRPRTLLSSQYHLQEWGRGRSGGGGGCIKTIGYIQSLKRWSPLWWQWDNAQYLAQVPLTRTLGGKEIPMDMHTHTKLDVEVWRQRD